MKLCPSCRSTYTDDTLTYCLQDGTPLVDAAANPSGDQTLEFNDRDTGGADRRMRIGIGESDDGPETKVRASRPTIASKRPRKGRRLVYFILGTALVAFFLTLISLAIYLFVYDGAKNLLPRNSSVSGLSDDRPGENGDKTAPGDQTPSPGTTPDPARIREEVRSKLNLWKRLTEKKDLDGLMACYAGTLKRYFNRYSVKRSAVRADKESAFKKLDALNISLTDLQITPGSNGKTATAIFDKQWRFTGPDKVSTGKVRSEVDFELSGDTWLITGERDLKVYYSG